MTKAALSRGSPHDAVDLRKDRKDGLAAASVGAAYRIGIVDLDVYAGFLPSLLTAINDAQEMFRLMQVVVPVHAELAISGKRTHDLIRKHGKRINKEDLKNNVYGPDLYRVGGPVTKSLGFDALGLLVSRMIIHESSNEELEWNLFAAKRGRIFAVSGFGLREYSARAGRTFEASLAALIVGEVFVVLFPRLKYHPETRGCLFDFCDDRDDVVQGLKQMRICEECLSLIPAAVRANTVKVVDAIASYRRNTGRPNPKNDGRIKASPE